MSLENISRYTTAALAVLTIAYSQTPAAHASGLGLAGTYYQVSSSPENIATALADVAASSGPTATFTATTVCFPSCGNTVGDSSTIADFLGGNATHLTSNSVTDLSNHVILLNGDLSIATAGTYSFSLGSDDGSEFSLDNNVVITNDGDHSFGYQNADIFLGAGLHTIKILQFEDGGSTGFSLLENGSSLPASDLSTVPLPGAIGLFGSAIASVLSLAGLRRTRTNKKAA